MAQYDKELDASGLNCPLPILRAKKALNDMQPGQVCVSLPPTLVR
jgi:tRNA 2-thiouridine synthesizing protein A